MLHHFASGTKTDSCTFSLTGSSILPFEWIEPDRVDVLLQLAQDRGARVGSKRLDEGPFIEIQDFADSGGGTHGPVNGRGEKPRLWEEGYMARPIRNITSYPNTTARIRSFPLTGSFAP